MTACGIGRQKPNKVLTAYIVFKIHSVCLRKFLNGCLESEITSDLCRAKTLRAVLSTKYQHYDQMILQKLLINSYSKPVYLRIHGDLISINSSSQYSYHIRSLIFPRVKTAFCG